MFLRHWCVVVVTANALAGGDLSPGIDLLYRKPHSHDVVSVSDAKRLRRLQSKGAPVSLIPEVPVATNDDPLDLNLIVSGQGLHVGDLAFATQTSRKGFLFGGCLALLAISIHWFNERRSVKLETMMSRGLAECISVDPEKVDDEHRGRLVHTTGFARGVVEVRDPQFDGVVFNTIGNDAGVVKLQSTVEVFEWTQTKRARMTGRDLKTTFACHSEWTNKHIDSSAFKKPHPDNPRLPSKLDLGTRTFQCEKVFLGAYTLPFALTQKFRNYELAGPPLLPQTMRARNLVFTYNADGYYYARQSGSDRGPSSSGWNPAIGDLRARFLIVRATEATVVAVQRELAPAPVSTRAESWTFIPYRPVARCCCASDAQERQMLIEQGERPLRELVKERGCESDLCISSCLCCPCNALQASFRQEVVTEEIFHISQGKCEAALPFQTAVWRNGARVRFFRLLGWLLMFLALRIILAPVYERLPVLSAFNAYGAHSLTMACATLSLMIWAVMIVLAYSCFQPVLTVKWMLIACATFMIPYSWGKAHMPAVHLHTA